MSSILATMSITKADGEEKLPIDIRRDFSSGIARYAHFLLCISQIAHVDMFPSHPVPFNCSIKPRSEAHAVLINNAVDSHA